MSKPVVLLLGKIPPPYYGPSIATEIILRSKLKYEFNLRHFDTRINADIKSIGKFSLLKIWRVLLIYLSYVRVINCLSPSLVVIPVSQTKIGFFKDSMFYWFASRKKSKVLFYLRGSSLTSQLLSSCFIFRLYCKKILLEANGIIVLGEKIKDTFEGFIESNKIFIVPNGANYAFSNRIIRRHNFVNILFLSNLQPQKGIIEFIQALKVLKINDFEFSAFIYGSWRDDKTKIACKKLTNDNKLPIVFNEPVYGNDKILAFSEADIFVFPPNSPEGHPWVIIEAMAAGLPIISTDQGAITESVIDGVNGFIVKPNCPEEIADRIKYLIENPKERLRMGRESRRLYEENFTEDKMVERLAGVFNKVLSQN